MSGVLFLQNGHVCLPGRGQAIFRISAPLVSRRPFAAPLLFDIVVCMYLFRVFLLARFSLLLLPAVREESAVEAARGSVVVGGTV